MKCGILCDAAKNPKWTLWERLFKTPVLTEYNEGNCHILILYLPYTAAQLSELSVPKAVKLWIRAANMLIDAGAEYLYLPDWCEDYKNLHDTFVPLFEICDGQDLMVKTAHMILEQWMAQSHSQPDTFELGIYRSSFDRQAGELLLLLGGNLKYVTLFCDYDDKAAVYADDVFEQTGLCAGISKNFAADHRRCGVLILLDPPPECSFAEHQTVMDLSGGCHSYCINTEIFTCPAEFLPIKQLFDSCDQRFAAFVLESSGRTLKGSSSAKEVLRETGLNLKNTAYVKRKQKPA